ncbi:quinone oxidoreductase family protein [Phenylobacterium sp.]|jgi:NADPH2:quinone reductase|uniref:quinone oxidoreductase family protein n=1 Tax=Phenylobacterium sp. TaxID=1871053 RepID=UPI0037C5C37F
MRAIRFTTTGGPDVLDLVELPDPQPGPGQILVRQVAVGVNYIDTYHRSGLYPLSLPSGLGMEGAGEVMAAGEGVERFGPGDRVAFASGPIGAYSDLHLVDARRAVRIPEGVDERTAAAALLKGMTAEFLLLRCRPLRAGEPVLIHAAAGGVGQILVQWARALGAEVIATAGSSAKADRVRALGAHHVILYGEQDVAAEVRRITGGAGVPVAYDSVGASTFEGTLASLARRGSFVSFGNASGSPPAVEPARLMRMGSLFFTRPTLGDYVSTTEELDASAAAVFSRIRTGEISIEIGQTFPLSQARTAHEALESRQTVGSTLLIP